MESMLGQLRGSRPALGESGEANCATVLPSILSGAALFCANFDIARWRPSRSPLRNCHVV